MKTIPSLVRGQGRIMSTFSPQVMAAIDLGSSKTVCLIAEWNPGKKSAEFDARNGLKILGFGQTVSRGIRSGAVANVSEAERSIRIAVDAAERMAKTMVKSIHVNVSGGRPSTILTSASIKTETGTVSQDDVDAAVSLAVGRLDIGRRHVLHLLPVSFMLDGVVTPQAPIGMLGETIAAEIAVVTMNFAALGNLRMAIEGSHLGLNGLSLTSYASARAVLAPDEMDLGTLLIDFGGFTTSLAAFRNGRLAGSAVLPMGGQHVTNDIAHGLSTTVVHAERLKTLFGSVLGNGHDDKELLSVPLLGERGVDTVQKVPKHVLASIILPRLDELMDHIRLQFSSGPIAGHVVNRIVITGGASQLHGMREFVSDRLGLPVRLGAPMGFSNLPDLARNGTFAAAAGLLLSICDPASTFEMPHEAKAAIDRSQMTYAKRLGRWLAEAL